MLNRIEEHGTIHEKIDFARKLATFFARFANAPLPSRPSQIPPTRKLDAYINWGRWIVECSTCATATLADSRFRFFACYNPQCGDFGVWKTVEFPENKAELEEELLKRDRIAQTAYVHRNWTPGQTVDDLKRERETGQDLPERARA